MTIVKICGMRTIEHALTAAEAGADLLGFIFAPARRQVRRDEVAQISAAVRAGPRGGAVTLVGVFVNEIAQTMLDIAAACDLDALQLSGDEDVALARELLGQNPRLQIIKAIRMADTPAERAWYAMGEQVRLMVDAHVPGSYGGAGVAADWQRAAELAQQWPILLAGGLGADNVAQAIAQVRPWGVDVSSGVETDGIKDHAKIRAFVAATRQADRA